jgi:hypothetical protein
MNESEVGYLAKDRDLRKGVKVRKFCKGGATG